MTAIVKSDLSPVLAIQDLKLTLLKLTSHYCESYFQTALTIVYVLRIELKQQMQYCMHISASVIGIRLIALYMPVTAVLYALLHYCVTPSFPDWTCRCWYFATEYHTAPARKEQ